MPPLNTIRTLNKDSASNGVNAFGILFRVFQRDNPGLLLVPVGMNRGVQAMVASVDPAMAAGANLMA